MTDIEDPFTELVDATIPRVDLVDKAANGMRFLIAKQADGAGLFGADFVRELLAKSETAPEPEQEVVTMSGSPAAIAKMIHEAGRKTTTTDPAAAVAKELELDESPDGMDTDVLLAAPEGEASGSVTDPGSPAWEAIDAATARKWTSILARAKVAVDLLADREMLEAATGDEDDMSNAWDLQDACCAIDYAISILAPFAVDEQSEADCGELMEAVGKALAGFDAAPLDTIETLGQVRKAGRVLSTANESAIRGAVESLQKVLSSLPAAPTVPEDGQSVAKEMETDMPEPTQVEDTLTDAGETPEMGIAKADGEKVPQVAVYDKKGNLVGICDPADIVMIAGAEAEEPEPADDTPAAEAAPEVTDLTPAPADEAGTPADAVPAPEDDAVTKQTVNPEDVLKSIAADAVAAALDTYSATQEQDIAKQADLAQLAKQVEELTELVKALEEQPAMPKVFTNGAVPPRDLRGMDRGSFATDVVKAQERRRTLYQSADASEQNRVANEMQTEAIARLQEIQRG